MTKCNWKLGLYLWAAALFAVLPNYAQAQTKETKNPQILQYSGSNKVVAAEVAQFNKQAKAADPATLAALSEKRDDMKKKRDAAYMEFKEAQFNFNLYWALAEAEVSWKKTKTIGNDVANSVKHKLNFIGEFFTGQFDEAWGSLKGGAASDWSAIKGAVSGAASTAWSITKMQGQLLLETATNVNFMVNQYESEVNDKYANTNQAGPLYEYIKKMREAANKYQQYSDAYLSIGKNVKGADVYVYTDPETGAEVYFTYKDGVAETVSGATRGCIPLPMKLAEGKSCIFCPLFKTIFNAAQTMATQSYAVLATSIANVLLVGLAIWIAFSVMVKVSSFTKMDTPKFITELLVQTFKVLLAYLILKNSHFIYDYAVGPLLKAGMEFGMSLLFERGHNYLGACGTADTMKNIGGGLIPSYLYVQLECFIQAVQAELAVPQSIGSTLMCVARHAASQDLGAVNLIVDVRLPDFSMMFQGLIIWVFAWLVSLAFAFYLIDATVRLGIIGALMPFLIASWPFKATSKYTAQGWSMFMNTFFTFVFMGLVVSVNIQLMGYSMTGAKGGFEAIITALNADLVTEIKDLLDIGFAGFLVLIASCIFGFKLTAQATELAGSMAGGGGSSPIGSSIGTLAASAAKGGVQGAGKATWGATKIVGNTTGVTPKLRQAKDATKAWVGRKLGYGSNSGAAGGGSSSTTSNRPVTPPSQTQPNPNTPFVIRGNQQQADDVRNADPRNQDTPVTPTHNEQRQTPTHNEQTPPQTPEQLRQQLENDYNNTANGKAGQQMILNQAAEVTRNKKTENEAQGRMNYHNKRADEYLKKAESAPDPVQKKKFEDLANAQFEEAAKAEQAYFKARSETMKSEAELQAVKHENERYKNQYVQDEMKKRNPVN